VDAAKGLCILLVVAGHAIINLNNNGYATGIWEEINLVIGPVRMPLFFLLSGLFAAKALSENWRKFADRRIWVMLWLLVLWVPIRETWLAMIPRTTLDHSGDIAAPAGFAPENWGPMVGRMLEAVQGPPSYLWFLYALALFAVLSKATRRVHPVIQILVAGAVAMCTPELDLGWPWNDILHTYVFYLVGMYAAPWIHRLARLRSLPVILGATAVYTAVGLWIYNNNDHFNLGLNGPVKVCLASVGIIAVISAVSALEGSPLLRPLIAVGSRTLPVFIMHIMVLATVTFVADLVLPGDPGLPLQPLILAAIVVTFCLGLHRLLTSCGFAWLFRRPAWTRRWYLRSLEKNA
jgi:uncharacterized membrane protein YcfT